jgi:hypothetical protein
MLTPSTPPTHGGGGRLARFAWTRLARFKAPGLKPQITPQTVIQRLPQPFLPAQATSSSRCSLPATCRLPLVFEGEGKVLVEAELLQGGKTGGGGSGSRGDGLRASLGGGWHERKDSTTRLPSNAPNSDAYPRPKQGNQNEDKGNHFRVIGCGCATMQQLGIKTLKCRQ